MPRPNFKITQSPEGFFNLNGMSADEAEEVVFALWQRAVRIQEVRNVAGAVRCNNDVHESINRSEAFCMTASKMLGDAVHNWKESR